MEGAIGQAVDRQLNAGVIARFNVLEEVHLMKHRHSLLKIEKLTDIRRGARVGIRPPLAKRHSIADRTTARKLAFEPLLE